MRHFQIFAFVWNGNQPFKQRASTSACKHFSVHDDVKASIVRSRIWSMRDDDDSIRRGSTQNVVIICGVSGCGKR